MLKKEWSCLEMLFVISLSVETKIRLSCFSPQSWASVIILQSGKKLNDDDLQFVNAAGGMTDPMDRFGERGKHEE